MQREWFQTEQLRFISAAADMAERKLFFLAYSQVQRHLGVFQSFAYTAEGVCIFFLVNINHIKFNKRHDHQVGYISVKQGLLRYSFLVLEDIFR